MAEPGLISAQESRSLEPMLLITNHIASEEVDIKLKEDQKYIAVFL